MSRFQRVMAIVLTVLTVCFAGLWAYLFAYVTAMSCAFSTSGNCSAPTPWEMRGEDLQIFVLIPGAIFIVLLVITVLLWRKRSSGNVKM
ncbi:hypothetical protein [Litoreibacter janthinus]|uniref:Uncharacterized protein n=1 Tax=Litoreibacter janthinus TaxID=670154 RepID=A0A1I6GII4_9RHOB|nr:hypothetical protein [Litoreibacter janthinus]SFR42005.1 hypothetical protein SAMN04488002_1533 [Litoreibacter janthinus]